MREKNQVVLPLNLGICIPDGDFVFKVAEICESLDYTELFNTYLRIWRKVNPVTMFEILVFAYMNRKFSSREIESLCKTDIRFMWLLNGEPAPSHATISRFEDEKLSEAIEGLFYQFVNKLYEMGEVTHLPVHRGRRQNVVYHVGGAQPIYLLQAKRKQTKMPRADRCAPEV